jgi:hypothetical protein
MKRSIRLDVLGICEVRETSRLWILDLPGHDHGDQLSYAEVDADDRVRRLVDRDGSTRVPAQRPSRLQASERDLQVTMRPVRPADRRFGSATTPEKLSPPLLPNLGQAIEY